MRKMPKKSPFVAEQKNCVSFFFAPVLFRFFPSPFHILATLVFLKPTTKVAFFLPLPDLKRGWFSLSTALSSPILTWKTVRQTFFNAFSPLFLVSFQRLSSYAELIFRLFFFCSSFLHRFSTIVDLAIRFHIAELSFFCFIINAEIPPNDLWNW